MITSLFRFMLSRLNKALANQPFYGQLTSVAEQSSRRFKDGLSGSLETDLLIL